MKDLKYVNEITVLVPMYNAEKTIAKCIKSICNQTYSKLKIIVVDDGSVDNSYKIVENLSKFDKRIILLHKENEKSLSKTRNFLLGFVKTKYFVFVDSDDTVHKRFIETLYSAITKYNADCSAVSFKINGILPFSSIFKRNKIIESNEIIPTMILNKSIHYVVWNKMYKTEIIQQYNIDTSVNFGEDFAFCLDYLSRCKKVIFINKCLYNYKLQKGSMIHQKFSKSNIDFLNYLENKLNNVTNANTKSALESWIAFTSASYKYLMKKSKYVDEKLTERLNKNISKYETTLKSNKCTNCIYKLSFKLMKKTNR